MNRTLRFLTYIAAMLAICLGAKAQEEAPLIPVGSISAFPTIVQTGTHPQVSWDITVPEPVNDVVEIEPPGTLKPKRCVIMDVRVLGASVKRVWTNNWGQVVDWEWVPTEARIKYNSGSYDRIFFDTNDDVNPNRIVHSQIVEKDSTVNFGARYVNSNNTWATWYSTTNSDHNVIALMDGDTPPTTTPMYQQPTIESFILPYLDADGKITLGARDVIILMELTHTDRNHGGFDLQDMALLVTFYDEIVEDGVASDCAGATGDDGTIDGGDSGSGSTGGDSGSGDDGSGDSGTGHNNNGHGNNEDGVDSSNPGHSKDGQDTDPNHDDEKGRGRRKK